MGNFNFKEIIEDRIRQYRKNLKENQYKLFILYFLLLDCIDLKGNHSLIDDVFADIKLPPLKVATMFKLNFYLAFKAYKNPTLESFIKQKVQESQIRLDSSMDAADIQKGLSEQSKRNIVLRKK